MTELSNIRTTPMPEEMRTLLADYPRDTWDDNPHFKDATKRWMSAHQMFRKLGKIVRQDAELYLDKDHDPEEYARRLSFYGNQLIGNLHGHHAWEDYEYFPELSAADNRFDRGLEILESDHEELDRVLDRFARVANRTVQLIQLDETQARDTAGEVHAVAENIEAFLARHLSDEEDLAVPIILHHKLRG